MNAVPRAYRELPHEVELAALATRQHGVVSTAQLSALGLDKDDVLRRVRAGRLHRLHRGVYAVGHRAVGRRGRDLAAVLACGPGAVLSHRSAAALHGFRRHAGLPEVTVPRTGARGRRGMHVHVSRTLTSDTVTRRDVIPVTTPERTLVDLADVLHPDDLARTVSGAERAGLADRRTLHLPAGRRNPVHRPHVWTRSGFERRVGRAIAAWGLPEPRRNVELPDVPGWEFDLAWPERRVVVELDHPWSHHNPESFESDPLKAEAALEAGYAFRRVTERRFAERPEDVRRLFTRLLAG